MGKSCVVTTCRNWFNARKKRRDPNLHFFGFPKDPVLRAAWLHKCGQQDTFNIDFRTICSDHFLPEEDYDPSYLMKKRLMGSDAKATLRKGAMPSLRLPCHESRKTRASKSEGPRQEAADGAAADPDDPEERRKRSQELRKERQEKRERKELVERLLAEHEEKQQAEQASQAEAPVEVIELVQCKDGARRSRKSDAADPAWYGDSLAVAAAEAGIVPGPAAAAPPQAAALSDDDRPPFEDEGAAPDDGSDDDEAATAPLKDAQKSASIFAALWASPPKTTPTRSPAPAVSCRRIMKRSDLMLQRTKEILRLKQKVRKLEDKCVSVLAVPGAPRPTAGTGVHGDVVTDDGKAAEEGDGAEAAPAAPAAGETPLIVLRDDRGSKLPTILSQLRQNQLSDGMVMFTPSDLQEAQEVNHRLKVQFLTLQAAMLKWAIKNKRIRDAKLKETEERRQKSTKVVRGTRLRELLRLEAAVKAMFTETQIRAITHDHGGPSGGDSLEKRRFSPHWGEEDLRRMLELRAISSDKVVEHVREKMKIPLPSMVATKQRCKKSPELNEAFKEMLLKSEENQKRCGMCERQVNTIDEVIEAVDGLPSDGGEDVPFGRQFVQHLPRHSLDTAVPRQRKRRRAPAAPVPVARKKVRQVAAASHDWADTSDSDAELSDPGIWGRIPLSRVGGQSEVMGRGAPPLPPLSAASSPYGQQRKAWR